VQLGKKLEPEIQIWKELGSMYIWNHGQSFSGIVYNTKVAVYLNRVNFDPSPPYCGSMCVS
jgi:hypothetical protein